MLDLWEIKHAGWWRLMEDSRVLKNVQVYVFFLSYCLSVFLSFLSFNFYWSFFHYFFCLSVFICLFLFFFLSFLSFSFIHFIQSFFVFLNLFLNVNSALFKPTTKLDIKYLDSTTNLPDFSKSTGLTVTLTGRIVSALHSLPNLAKSSERWSRLLMAEM